MISNKNKKNTNSNIKAIIIRVTDMPIERLHLCCGSLVINV